jgi:hypothetical protein
MTSPVRLLARLLAAVLLPVLLMACTAMDPEYKTLEKQALVQCRGDEVVGVWVSKITAMGFPQRRTLLLRPDGTGRMRLMTEGVMKEEFEAGWKYSGGGVWYGSLSQLGLPMYVFKIRTTGKELLYHVYNIANVNAVFLRAD